MKIKEWVERHGDVKVQMDTYQKGELSMIFGLYDKSKEGRKAKRVIPVAQLPLDQDEMILEDYISSVLELLYRNILAQRDKDDERSKSGEVYI